MLPGNRGQRHIVQVDERHPLLHLTRYQHDLLDVLEHEVPQISEDFDRHDLWFLLDKARHHTTVHHKAGSVPLVPTMYVKEARLEQSHRQIGQSWLGRERRQPRHMLHQTLSRFLHIVVTSLDPLKPVAFVPIRGHLNDPLLCHRFLESIDTVQLELSEIVPTEVHESDIFCSVVGGYVIFTIGYEVVGLGRGNIMRVLAIVSGVVRIVGIWVIYRSSELLKILLISPFLVKVALLILLMSLLGFWNLLHLGITGLNELLTSCLLHDFWLTFLIYATRNII